MRDFIVLRDLEQIKAISQQNRLNIIEAFDNESKTAKQIAEYLNEPHGRVNYHIKVLEKVGIVELVEEVTRMGIVEKYYCPVAKSIKIDSNAVALDANLSSSISNISLAFFEGVSKDFIDSIQHYNGLITRKISHYSDFYLTEEEAKELNTRLNSLVDEYLVGREDPRSGAVRHSLATMVFAMPEKE